MVFLGKVLRKFFLLANLFSASQIYSWFSSVHGILYLCRHHDLLVDLPLPWRIRYTWIIIEFSELQIFFSLDGNVSSHDILEQRESFFVPYCFLNDLRFPNQAVVSLITQKASIAFTSENRSCSRFINSYRSSDWVGLTINPVGCLSAVVQIIFLFETFEKNLQRLHC